MPKELMKFLRGVPPISNWEICLFLVGIAYFAVILLTVVKFID